MRSIRLALIVYLLILLVVALGAVSGLVYGITYRAIHDKEKSTENLLCAQYKHRARTINENFDQRILRRAQTLASMAQSQWSPERFPDLHLVAGLGTLGAQPNGYALAPLWIQTTDRRLYFRAAFKILFADDVLAQGNDNGEDEYFQLYNGSGVRLQRSRSMIDKKASFTLDPSLKNNLEELGSGFDDTELLPGVKVRRVTLKAPVSHFRRPPRPPRPALNPRATAPTRPSESNRGEATSRGEQSKSPSSSSRGASSRKAEERPRPPAVISSPFVFIQCAHGTRKRDAQLDELASREKEDVNEIQTDSKNRLAALRRDLAWIAAGALLASLCGGFLLVRLGLVPLERLSDAVTHVSERNFRLPIDEKTVPVELRPIISRLQDSLQLLGRAFEREKQAAADISHELRTPVAALLTSIEVTLRRQRSPEEYREVLDECRHSVQQISHLVERLLALARLDAGADHLRPIKVNATAIAQQCATMVQPLADARGLRLNVLSSQPVMLTADPDKLREVVTNLLHNAIQYNRPDGAVDVTVERENGSLCMEVRDTGVGIEPEARERIFERFYRADAARQSDGVHAGLGLAIVKGYVELMGGSIAVDSTVGKGSRFSIRIPIDAHAHRN